MQFVEETDAGRALCDEWVECSGCNGYVQAEEVLHNIFPLDNGVGSAILIGLIGLGAIGLAPLHDFLLAKNGFVFEGLKIGAGRSLGRAGDGKVKS